MNAATGRVSLPVSHSLIQVSSSSWVGWMKPAASQWPSLLKAKRRLNYAALRQAAQLRAGKRRGPRIEHPNGERVDPPFTARCGHMDRGGELVPLGLKATP